VKQYLHSLVLSCLIQLLRLHNIGDRGINEQQTLDEMILPEKKYLVTNLSQCHFVPTTNLRRNGLRCSLGICGMRRDCQSNGSVSCHGESFVYE
jgi:hypothetical protein